MKNDKFDWIPLIPILAILFVAGLITYATYGMETYWECAIPKYEAFCISQNYSGYQKNIPARPDVSNRCYDGSTEFLVFSEFKVDDSVAEACEQ